MSLPRLYNPALPRCITNPPRPFSFPCPSLTNEFARDSHSVIPCRISIIPDSSRTMSVPFHTPHSPPLRNGSHPHPTLSRPSASRRSSCSFSILSLSQPVFITICSARIFNNGAFRKLRIYSHRTTQERHRPSITHRRYVHLPFLRHIVLVTCSQLNIKIDCRL